MTVRLKQLLVAVLGYGLALVFVFLGLWQMQVFESQKSDTTAQRAAEPARDLESNLTEGKVGDLYGRRVRASGTYLPEQQYLVGTEQPLRVLTALRTDAGRTLAVVRGTVNGTTIPAPQARAPVSIGTLPTRVPAAQPGPPPTGSRLTRWAASGWNSWCSSGPARCWTASSPSVRS